MTTELISPTLVSRLDTIGEHIGNTPLYPIRRAYQKEGVEIYVKLEWYQLGQSVKARPAYQIVRDAVLSGELTPEKRLIDATSGNTGIAYASICASMGIPLTICMPENASKERKTILKSLGAELIYTSPFEATDGSQLVAQEMVAENPDLYYYADQYNNPSNWRAHYLHTAREIYHQTQGKITHFVAGLGTTGTFTGTSRKFMEINPEIQLVSLQPETAMHGLEGWKDLETAKVPGIYDDSLSDRQLRVGTDEAYKWMKIVAEKEGLLISPSAAANLAGAVQVAEAIDQGVIVTLFADDASKYSDLIDSIFS